MGDHAHHHHHIDSSTTSSPIGTTEMAHNHDHHMHSGMDAAHDMNGDSSSHALHHMMSMAVSKIKNIEEF